MCSFDARMEKMPVLISYPRSGSNWFNSVMELYFNRPRLRVSPSSFLNDIGRRNDFMWFHDHDIFCKLKLTHNMFIYLYRDPRDVVFSLLSVESKHITTKTVGNQIKLLGNHYDRYLLGNRSKAIINYEALKGENYVDEFKKFIYYFNPGKFNKIKLDKVLTIVSKEALIKRNKRNEYFTKNLLSKEYEDNRVEFKVKYGDIILSKLISPKLRKFFQWL